MQYDIDIDTPFSTSTSTKYVSILTNKNVCSSNCSKNTGAIVIVVIVGI